MPNYTEQQLADILDISVEENARRNAVAAARRRVVQTPRGSSYIADFESSPVLAYAVSINQSRPIHADFDSGFAYNLFLNSKYKHHHKCATCQIVFRCGQAKCERTLCRICNLSNQFSAITWPTDTVVNLNFNGSFGGSWTNIGTGHEVIVAYDEATQHTAQNQVTVDYEAVERQLINEETATGRVDGDIEV